MRILLDRFDDSNVEFIDAFEDLGHSVPYVTVLDGAVTKQCGKSTTRVISDFEFIRQADNCKPFWKLTGDQLQKLAVFEGRFITLASRYAVSPAYWSAQEISELYFSLANTWNVILEKEKIDVIFALNVPHEPASLSLYIMSKILKIPYIFIDPVVIFSRLRYFSCSIANRNILIEESLASDDVKAHLEEYQNAVSSRYKEALPPVMALVNAAANKSAFRIFFRDLISVGKGLIFFLEKDSKPAGGYFKVARGRWGSTRSYFKTRLGYDVFRLISNLRLGLRKFSYRRICTAQLPDKFIYFPAPLEPEASNQPLANEFKHVRLILRLLSSCIEDDVKIVFKVSPAQFTNMAPMSAYVHWHEKSFYRDLKELGNIVFIDPKKFDSKDLILKSSAVAAINGTVAIEALFLGRQSLVFAPMWYEQLSGIHRCRDEQNVRRALELCRQTDIPPVSFSNLRFAESSSFFSSKHVPNSFDSADVNSVVAKFLSALESFRTIDSSTKWDF